ncbi:MAG: hypothetical protein RIQ89_1402 [Bacteroidota bacterium]|jgi:hypothetical protein
MKLNQHTLDKLIELASAGGYKVRSEKGNFKSGSCILQELKVIVLNKFATPEAKAAYLIEALRQIVLNTDSFNDKQHVLYNEIKQLQIAV